MRRETDYPPAKHTILPPQGQITISYGVELSLALPYVADIGDLIDRLKAIAGSIRDVVATPAPSVAVTNVNENETAVVVYCWVEDSDQVEYIRGELYVAIDRSLREAGIYGAKEAEEAEAEKQDD